jgi:protein-disulfide isomerase
VENQVTQPTPMDTAPPVETIPSPLPAPEPDTAPPNTVLVIPRVVFNYAVIAVVFFALGAVISAAGMNALFNANSDENLELLDRMVNQVVAAQGQNTAQQGLQVGQQYDVTVDDNPSRGAEDAIVTIVEFSDFHCPYCGRFVKETLEPILANYEGQVRLVFRDYPILGASSVLAALAGECADDQGAFWGFHDRVFADQQNLTREAFIGYAEEMNLNVGQFTACLDSQEKMDEITVDYNFARSLGITGTPAFFINGVFISGAQPYSVFEDVINQEIGKAQESTPEPSSSSS